MRGDPVVKEARRAGDLLARQYDYDLHRLCEHFREAESRFEARIYRSQNTQKHKRITQKLEHTV